MSTLAATTCPTCGNPMRPGLCSGRKVMACLCGYMTEVRPKADAVPVVALKLPGLDPGRQQKQVRERSTGKLVTHTDRPTSI